MNSPGTELASRPGKSVLILASTFPRWQGDTEPAFIEMLGLQLARYHKVCVLAPHFAGAKTSEVWEGNLATGVRSSEVSIDVFRFRYCSPPLEKLAYNGGILSNLSRNPFLYALVPLFLIGQLARLVRLHRQFRFDVIHAHWIVPQGLVATVFRKLCPARSRPALIVTSHGGDLFALNGFFLQRCKRWILDNADAVTVVSRVMKRRCTGLGIDPAKILVRSMGVCLSDTFTVPAADRSRRGIVFVGRLVEKKGVDILLQAMALLPNDTCLKIVGDGPLRASLQALAAELSLGARVTFAGSIPNSDVPEVFRSGLLAVVPSVVSQSGDQEGLGLVVVEAMGCGCPVVASNLPAIRDVIEHEQTGLLTEPGNAADLAQKIRMLTASPALRERLAVNARLFASENFDWPSVAREYASLIDRVQPAPSASTAKQR